MGEQYNFVSSVSADRMTDKAEKYVDWLFEQQKEGMVNRASWIDERRPDFAHGVLHHGGEETAMLYEDAQLSFVHGLYTGTIVLGQSYIERSVCAFAYSAGHFSEDDRPGYHDAVHFLKENELITSEDIDGVQLEGLHELRNPIVHFRPVTDESTLSGRQLEVLRQQDDRLDSPKSSYEMLEDDSKQILRTMFSIVRIFGIGPIVE